jgi:hypothetical protein
MPGEPLFAEEVRLGRMPIPEAFAELAKREPRLSELESDMSRRRRANRALKLVGPDAATPDALLTTTTAGDIAGAYLWKAADERGHITSALFDGRSFESHGQFGFG